MGLDMFLHKKTYVWSNDQQKITIKGFEGVKPERVTEIVEDVGYWRKANAIHQWFVTHVQNGEDDCREYYVSKEQLQQLLDTVNKVLDSCELVPGKIINGYTYKDGKQIPNIVEGKEVKDPSVAKQLLPTTSGFFFGGTEYDEYYVQELEETKKILEQVIKEKGDFYYHSSW